MNCRIYVAYHQPGAYVKSDIYRPVCVGDHKDSFSADFIRDDEGDNIAGQNDKYNELTVLYRVWKDESLHADYIGLAHYRRYLGLGLNETHYLYRTPERAMRKVRKSEKYWRLLPADVDVVAPYPAHYHSVREYYGWAHDKKDIDLLLALIGTYCPEYLSCAKEYFDGQENYLCNLTVMKKEVFLRYAAWIFNLLEKFLSVKTDADRLYISERLTGIFIKKMEEESKKVIYAPIVSVEPKDDFKRAARKIRASKEKGKQKWKPMIHYFIPTFLWRRYYRSIYRRKEVIV